MQFLSLKFKLKVGGVKCVHTYITIFSSAAVAVKREKTHCSSFILASPVLMWPTSVSFERRSPLPKQKHQNVTKFRVGTSTIIRLGPLWVNQFRCHEAQIEESESAGSHHKLNQGHLWLEPPVFCHWAIYNSRTTTNPHNPLHVLHRWYWIPRCARPRGVLGSTPGGCQPFHFPLFSPHNI